MVVTAIVGAGVIGAGAALGGAAMTSSAATSAANTQANAAITNQNNLLAMGKQASGMDIGAIGTVQGELSPYTAVGATAANRLNIGLANGSLTKGFAPTMAQLNAMPGYQFEKQQGLEATQNGFAAKGLGSSGAAMKGAGQYAQGLASTDLNNLANIYYTNQANAYNRLSGTSNMGLNAASTEGQLTANLTQAGSNALMGTATNVASLGMAGANAQAAGMIGSANSWANGMSGIGNSLSNGLIAGAVLGNGNPISSASNAPVFMPGTSTSVLDPSLLSGSVAPRSMYGAW